MDGAFWGMVFVYLVRTRRRGHEVTIHDDCGMMVSMQPTIPSGRLTQVNVAINAGGLENVENNECR